MDTSFLTKQVAKKITLLRHLSKQQLYEISITWETGSGEAHESLHYLPEIFLYPYAVRKDRASQSTKVSEISLFSDTSLDLEYTPNPNSINPRTPNLSQPIHHQ